MYTIMTLFLSLLATFRVAIAQAPPTVNLGYATYQGIDLEGADVNAFLGMRFAAPPLGNLRFRAPANPEVEEGIQDATVVGPHCIGVGEAISASAGEDCLFVNVFTPSSVTESSNLPVWVHIQGGGYAENAGPNYNGEDIIQQSGGNIIFVEGNYRVGALGFLASEKIRENGDLNVGLLDQRALLSWVQLNIQKFGGNPDHVVIHGASAGAGSVAHHLTAYNGEDQHLFVGAIPESSFWPTQRTVAEMEFQYTLFLQQTGCSTAADPLSCLRGQSLATLMIANVASQFPGTSGVPEWYFVPVIDGELITASMYTLFDQGKFVRVPVLVDNDSDEGSIFAPNAATPAEVQIFFQNQYPNLTTDQLNAIIEMYPLMQPLPEHEAWFPSASAAYGEACFICPGNEIASAVAKYMSPDLAWVARYNVQDPAQIAAGLGVSHTIDLAAIFGCGYAIACPASYTTINAPIVPITMHYYISFIIALNPNTFKLPEALTWESWGSSTGSRLRIQTDNTAMEDVPGDQIARCSAWKLFSASIEV